ncbi:hypothetical protein D1AOALGA4SA_9809 [Olavius algarvensis Delta 1 endosymbiont]|nr:hypothetical protein D1AOALGA4SA_9809 [Olavius algarvensis Delta 1 endosymbiont]
MVEVTEHIDILEVSGVRCQGTAQRLAIKRPVNSKKKL